jgi:hypothetical protein
MCLFFILAGSASVLKLVRRDDADDLKRPRITLMGILQQLECCGLLSGPNRPEALLADGVDCLVWVGSMRERIGRKWQSLPLWRIAI